MAQKEAVSDIAQLQRQVEHLQEEVHSLEDVLQRVLVAAPPIMLRMPDGTKRPFRPIRPVSLRVLSILMKAEESLQKPDNLSEEERIQRFHQLLEDARQEAIAKGIAIDDEREAAIGD